MPQPVMFALRRLYHPRGIGPLFTVKPDGTASAPPNFSEILNLYGTCVTHLGSGQYRVEKVTGAAGWSDAEAYSAVQIFGDFRLRIEHGALAANIGLKTSDPTLATNYYTPNYGWQINSGGAAVTFRGDGTAPGYVTNAIAPNAALPLWLGRDGDTLYWKNGADYATATVVDSQAGMFGVGLQLDTALNDIDGCFLLTFERVAVYNDTLSEPVTATDASSSSAIFVSPLSEGVTAAFSLSTSIIFPNALSESVAAADSLVAGLVMSAVLSESLTAAFTPTVAAVFASSLAEGITAAFVPTVAATFASALSEDLTATAAQTVAAIFANALTESVTAADSDGVVATFSNALAESAVAGAVLVDQLISGTTYNEMVSVNIVASGSYAFVGEVKAFDGGQWQSKPARAWNGSRWAIKPLKFWDGSGWKLS
jgi:hypothetical protein